MIYEIWSETTGNRLDNRYTDEAIARDVMDRQRGRRPDQGELVILVIDEDDWVVGELK